MDIVFTTYGIYTLAYVVIIDSTCADLVLQVIFFLGVVATIVVQPKVLSYRD
jgi:hypothetical protein